MTEQKLNPDNGMEQPQEESSYGINASWLVENAGNFNAKQLEVKIGSMLLDSVLEDAQQGKFVSGTSIYSIEDIIAIDGQLDRVMKAEQSGLDMKQWGKEVTRANGLRDAITTILSDKRLVEPFQKALIEKQAALQEEQDVEASIEMDAMIERAKLITDLGEDAVEAAPVLLADDTDTESSLSTGPENMADDERYGYLRTLLPPVTKPVTEPTPLMYDHLFDSNAPDPGTSQQFGQYKPKTEEEKRGEYYAKFVTEENRQTSQEFLDEVLKATPELRQILARYQLENESFQAVDAIREDADVRYEVAKVLAEKLDRLVPQGLDFGDRIVRNSFGNLKVDQITGTRMRSRVHAVGLALKMIDGQFSNRLDQGDEQRRADNGQVLEGQHRHAARSLLMSRF